MASKVKKLVRVKADDYEPAIVIFTRKDLGKHIDTLVKKVLYDWPVAYLADAVKAKGSKR